MNLEIVKSKNVLEMLTVAHEFCLFTETVEKHKTEDIFHYYHRICPLLYLKGVLLPEIEVEDNAAAERFVNEEQWEAVFTTLKNKFGKDDVIYYIEDSISGTETSIKSSLAEFIADVYQDMKDFVLLFQKNLLAAKENAVLDCKQLFITHWGLRTLEIPKAIHQITFNIQKDEII
ncbi:MAG: DUF5063 domain-containing protein [Bacteroidota bacterium]